MKHPFIALSLVAVAAGAICAPFALSQTATLEPLAADTGATPRRLEVTEFAHTSSTIMVNDKPWTSSQYPLARLGDEGNYFAFNQTMEDPHFNEGGNLYSATVGYGYFSIILGTARQYYLNETEYINNRPLSVWSFSKLTKIELYTGEGNTVELTNDEDGSDICNYDDKEKCYVFTLNPDKIYESFGEHWSYYIFAFSNAKEGDRFVVKKIVLTYTC